MSSAHLEITSGILRVFERDDGEYGDEYLYACALVGHGRTAVLKALSTGALRAGRDVRTAVRDCLLRSGFEQVVWERITEEESRMATWALESGLPADTLGRRAAHQMGNALVGMLKHGKKTGDHFRLIAPDGTVTELMLGDTSDTSDGRFRLELVEGREP